MTRAGDGLGLTPLVSIVIPTLDGPLLPPAHARYAVQRRAGVHYGDSSLWLRRSAFAALGGYRALPIMEDYKLVRRPERFGRTACLPGPAITSSRRWRARGVARTALAWTVIRWLWLAGAPADRLARLWRDVR